MKTSSLPVLVLLAASAASVAGDCRVHLPVSGFPAWINGTCIDNPTPGQPGSYFLAQKGNEYVLHKCSQNCTTCETKDMYFDCSINADVLQQVHNITQAPVWDSSSGARQVGVGSFWVGTGLIVAGLFTL
ncbi:uncharacterized protein SPPG_00901 [Spizellomyces punctatus DAOM BR117]|uniref:Uncharacterized protein n=1 Tax=Spizellomyces punctatus (strain DAOM BR117) TaxID=645134 RepID=A0A0L0HR52_SPIPD|nr:uncharacterized protein SPPG_00901 [Spizellomyces punctatus DAOM BR117]KND03415.1 hypothetical protein SPPG_00901 [Spizellomyces punctatus DAOM BR117]|eukprot:XP_016611454.1 hypothetical protein SPPG_00901 [Spizellomyces punctatus DAOM BR117]